MTSYCQIATNHPIHGPYHDYEYGFPLYDDNKLFERLSLEIMQAGLSWLLILKKRKAMQKAFSGFSIGSVANFTSNDVRKLICDKDIIRNKLKILSIIENAKRINNLKYNYGGFISWIDIHHPLIKKEWVHLFKNTFKFTGEKITEEFLMSIGYLPGAHDTNCAVYQKIVDAKPPWMTRF